MECHSAKAAIPVCRSWCLFSWSERENLRPHSVTSHWYGFSPGKKQTKNKIKAHFLDLNPNFVWSPCATSPHLCVCGRASEDGTVWSISYCSQGKHIQRDAFLWCLMTSPLVEGYWTLDKHPGGPRREDSGRIEHLLTATVLMQLCVNTDLNSSEDAVCVYVVLGADQYRRWGSYWVSLKAACVSTVETRWIYT